ncbi:hypothetical protein [Mycobacterium sp.]|uniref:hypothetical protein n=1 Tax=Mycobacterium sp. TaxID=1785 RepID=UPI003C727F73
MLEGWVEDARTQLLIRLDACVEAGASTENAQRSGIGCVVDDDPDAPSRTAAVEYQSASVANRLGNALIYHVDSIAHVCLFSDHARSDAAKYTFLYH